VASEARLNTRSDEQLTDSTTRGRHATGRGYPMNWYEEVVGDLLKHVSLGADVVAKVVDEIQREAAPDPLQTARVKRERAAATQRLERDRDTEAWQATMWGLDAEEAATKGTPPEVIPAAQVVAYLRNLLETWDHAKGGRGRADGTAPNREVPVTRMDDDATRQAFLDSLRAEPGQALAVQFLAVRDAISRGMPIDKARLRAAAFDYFDAQDAVGANPGCYFNWNGVLALPRVSSDMAADRAGGLMDRASTRIAEPSLHYVTVMTWW
jgi:hypothetical protein